MSAWYVGIKIIICSHTRENLYLTSIKKKSFLPSTQTSIRGKTVSHLICYLIWHTLVSVVKHLLSYTVH